MGKRPILIHHACDSRIPCRRTGRHAQYFVLSSEVELCTCLSRSFVLKSGPSKKEKKQALSLPLSELIGNLGEEIVGVDGVVDERLSALVMDALAEGGPLAKTLSSSEEVSGTAMYDL